MKTQQHLDLSLNQKLKLNLDIGNKESSEIFIERERIMDVHDPYLYFLVYPFTPLPVDPLSSYCNARWSIMTADSLNE